jgi:UV DNA damage endonuclease
METVATNLECLERILLFNIEKGLLFFRISSDLVPFASHPVCKFDWAEHFSEQFVSIGELIQSNGMRISMHPDQFTLLNSPRKQVVHNSIAELSYHAAVLDAMGLTQSAKIQIHVGGVYGDKYASVERFVYYFRQLPKTVQKRLVVENDDRSYSLRDCLTINQKTDLPVLFDSFHHQLNHNGESMAEALQAAALTWQAADGLLMVDYSSQHPDKKRGSHAERLDVKDFRKFMKVSSNLDFDLMLEIKDKEKSALRAIKLASVLH